GHELAHGVHAPGVGQQVHAREGGEGGGGEVQRLLGVWLGLHAIERTKMQVSADTGVTPVPGGDVPRTASGDVLAGDGRGDRSAVAVGHRQARDVLGAYERELLVLVAERGVLV